MRLYRIKSCLSLAFVSLIMWAPLSLAQIQSKQADPQLFGKIETLTHMRIHAAEPWKLASHLEDSGYDVLEGSITSISVDVIVSRADRTRLEGAGYLLEFIAQGRPLREIMAERNKNRTFPDPLYRPYEGSESIVDQLQTAAANYPAICQAVNLSTVYGITTYENRDMWAVKISDNVAQEENEPAFLVVSCHHAREIVTPEIALYAIDQFTSQYGIDQQITDAVNGNEIWIAPVWNPDGYQYAYDVDNMWRKNRREFPGEGFGVDQNRNYPFSWDSPCSGDTFVSSAAYKGPSPASEAETQVMIAWSEDQNFCKVIDYHSSGKEVLWSYAWCQSHPLDTFLQQEAIALSNATGYFGDNRAPSSQGEHYEWQLAEMGAHASLIETHTTFQPSYSSALAEAALVFPGIQWLLERPISLTGTVTESPSGDPIVASIDNLDVAYTLGEHNQSYEPFGMYHAFYPAGNYDMEFTAAGYDPQVHNVDIVAGQTTTLNVVFGAVAPPCPADVDENGKVDIIDGILVVEAYGNSGGIEDIDGSGTVDADDLDALCAQWGPCPEL